MQKEAFDLNYNGISFGFCQFFFLELQIKKKLKHKKSIYLFYLKKKKEEDLSVIGLKTKSRTSVQSFCVIFQILIFMYIFVILHTCCCVAL